MGVERVFSLVEVRAENVSRVIEGKYSPVEFVELAFSVDKTWVAEFGEEPYDEECYDVYLYAARPSGLRVKSVCAFSYKRSFDERVSFLTACADPEIQEGSWGMGEWVEFEDEPPGRFVDLALSIAKEMSLGEWTEE